MSKGYVSKNYSTPPYEWDINADCEYNGYELVQVLKVAKDHFIVYYKVKSNES
jgi:hypothetical protein